MIKGSAFRLAYLGTWLLFVLATVVLSWHDVRVYQLIVLVIGYLGTCLATMWSVRGGNWSRWCATASIAIVVSYLLWWTIEVSGRYAADPTPGALRTISVQVEIWGAILQQQLGRTAYPEAILTAYWLVGMPLAQLVLALFILLSKGERMGADESAGIAR